MKKKIRLYSTITFLIICASVLTSLYVNNVFGRNDIVKIDITKDGSWNTIEYFPGRNEESTTHIGAIEYYSNDNKMEGEITDSKEITGEIADQNIARYEYLNIVPVSEGVTTLKISYQGLTTEEKIIIKKAIPKNYYLTIVRINYTLQITIPKIWMSQWYLKAEGNIN